MENYEFNVCEARKSTPTELATVLTALIEVQYQAAIYRNTSRSSDKLSSWGICSNANYIYGSIMPRDIMYLSPIFFKSLKYPIIPYEPENFCTDDKEFRWGFNMLGNKRMKMLELMIKDLTEYLTKHAV